ncbi:IclR family transcriptional regulator [Thermodesulfobacteriota bacterium]
MRDNNLIRSLERGLMILETCGAASAPLTLTEIAKLSKLNKATTQRFLHTLCSLGYLNREDSKRYSLGTKVLSLGFNLLNSSNLRSMVKPYLDELSFVLDKTVNLAVLDNFDIIFLYRKEVSRFLKYDLQAGSKLPAYCTSSGKLLLAGLSNEVLRKRINKTELYQITPKTITAKERLWEEIMNIRKRGYSISDQELSLDLYTLAVPLIDGQGKIVAATNVSFAAKDKDSLIKETIITKLIETGEQISHTLGYKGPYPNLWS